MCIFSLYVLVDCSFLSLPSSSFTRESNIPDEVKSYIVQLILTVKIRSVNTCKDNLATVNSLKDCSALSCDLMGQSLALMVAVLEAFKTLLWGKYKVLIKQHLRMQKVIFEIFLFFITCRSEIRLFQLGVQGSCASPCERTEGANPRGFTAAVQSSGGGCQIHCQSKTVVPYYIIILFLYATVNGKYLYCRIGAVLICCFV